MLPENNETDSGAGFSVPLLPALTPEPAKRMGGAWPSILFCLVLLLQIFQQVILPDSPKFLPKPERRDFSVLDQLINRTF